MPSPKKLKPASAKIVEDRLAYLLGHHNNDRGNAVGQDVFEHQPEILIALKLSRHNVIRLFDGQHLASHHTHISCHG